MRFQWKYLLFFCIFCSSLFGRSHFLLIGSPGSGKGTFTQYLMKHGEYEHLCVGDILREEIKKETEIGQKIRDCVASGLLVPDEITFQLFRKRFVDVLSSQSSIIVDGMVQSPANVQFFDHLLEEFNLEDEFNYVYFSISRSLARERILSRMICEKCGAISNRELQLRRNCLCGGMFQSRLDDCQESVDRRIGRFFERVLPLVDCYRNREGFYRFDSRKELDEKIADYKSVFTGLRN